MVEINTTKPAPKTKPAIEPESNQLPKKPRLRSGAYSATKIEAPVYSPPTEKNGGHFSEQQEDRRPDTNMYLKALVQVVNTNVGLITNYLTWVKKANVAGR